MAANRVHQVKEKVENGLIEVTYVSTKDQCVDSFTKYLKGGEPQKKANMQLSLMDLDHWLPGKDLVTRAKKVRFLLTLISFSQSLNVFSVRVRIFSRALNLYPPKKSEILNLLMKMLKSYHP